MSETLFEGWSGWVIVTEKNWNWEPPLHWSQWYWCGVASHLCAPKVEQSGSEWGWGLNSAVDTLRIGLMIRLASAYRSWLGADKEQPSIVWCALKQDVRDVSSVHCPSFHRERRQRRISIDGLYSGRRLLLCHSLGAFSWRCDDGLWLMHLRYFVSSIRPFLGGSVTCKDWNFMSFVRELSSEIPFTECVITN